jgi:(R,R)-butanediol dehydrogenase / meso-butanediol dehydrogenase / diacetyl reductase
MKAAIFYGGGVIKIEEVKKPKPGPNEVVVKVAYCGLCGSDRHKFYHGWIFPLTPENRPKTSELKRLKYIPGHEVSGVIDDLGSAVKGFKKGDRVAVYCINYCGKCYYCKKGLTNYCIDFDKNIMSDQWDGGYAEYVKVPEKDLLKLPDDISLELGSLTLDTLGVPYDTFLEIDMNKGQSIAIYGCGPIGLSMIKMLNLKGINEIYAIDIVESKLKLAKEFGAKILINAAKKDPVKQVLNATNGEGVDIAYDMSNTLDAFRNSIYSVKKGGIICAIGEHPSLPPDLGEIFISDILIHRHLEIKGVMYFPIGEHKNILKVLREGKESFEKLITHIYPLDKINEAFNTFFEGNKEIRVLIKP